MRIANTLGRDDARRIARGLAMTDFSDSMTPIGASAASKLHWMRKSVIAVEDDEGKPLTTGLAHLRLEQLATLSDDLRRKLLQCGHVYVRLDNVRFAGMAMESGNAHGLFTFGSVFFGESVGIGRYTKPEPDIEALGVSDMGERFSFHRVMPEMYADKDVCNELQVMDSDLRLYVDLGAIEVAAFQEVPRQKGGR